MNSKNMKIREQINKLKEKEEKKVVMNKGIMKDYPVIIDDRSS
jgi:hypothetical protein